MVIPPCIAPARVSTFQQMYMRKKECINVYIFHEYYVSGHKCEVYSSLEPAALATLGWNAAFTPRHIAYGTITDIMGALFQ